jgi:DNA-binding XRE family transcriptional regulator
VGRYRFLQIGTGVVDGASVPLDGASDADAFAYALRRGIRAERSRVGLTQEQLSERMGWSRPTTSAIETGSRSVLAHELPGICDALGVTLAKLVQDAPESERRKLGL